MFKLIFFGAAFVAGGYLALRSPAVADAVNIAAKEFFEFAKVVKESI